jgi:Arc/MetJ-type ribon-helix-helix transcriptional regulator
MLKAPSGDTSVRSPAKYARVSAEALARHQAERDPAAVTAWPAALRAFRLDGSPPSYDPGMSDKKTRVTVTIDPHLAAYAEHLVEAGKAPSVSAVVNDALTERVERDRRIARRWKEITAQADMVQVERMIAHVEAQAEQLPASHRYR